MRAPKFARTGMSALLIMPQSLVRLTVPRSSRSMTASSVLSRLLAEVAIIMELLGYVSHQTRLIALEALPQHPSLMNARFQLVIDAKFYQLQEFC